jgi:hypothetical protein
MRAEGGGCGLLGLVGEAQLLDPTVEPGSGDPKQLGSPRLIVSGPRERLFDQAPLHTSQYLIQGSRRGRGWRQICTGAVATDAGGQVGAADLIIRPGRMCCFDHAGELSEVAGPIVGNQAFEGLRGESGPLTRPPLIRAFEEVLGQERQLVDPFPEGPEPEDEGGDGVIEVGPESIRLDREVGVSRGDRDEADPTIEGLGELRLEVAWKI